MPVDRFGAGGEALCRRPGQIRSRSWRRRWRGGARSKGGGGRLRSSAALLTRMLEREEEKEEGVIFIYFLSVKHNLYQTRLLRIYILWSAVLGIDLDDTSDSQSLVDLVVAEPCIHENLAPLVLLPPGLSSYTSWPYPSGAQLRTWARKKTRPQRLWRSPFLLLRAKEWPSCISRGPSRIARRSSHEAHAAMHSQLTS